MSGDLVRDDVVLTLEEVCERCSVPVTAVAAYIEEGLIEVNGVDAGHWRFSETSVVHIQRACRLERDLSLNPAGAVLALELMAEIERLKERLRVIAENSD